MSKDCCKKGDCKKEFCKCANDNKGGAGHSHGGKVCHDNHGVGTEKPGCCVPPAKKGGHGCCK